MRIHTTKGMFLDAALMACAAFGLMLCGRAAYAQTKTSPGPPLTTEARLARNVTLADIVNIPDKVMGRDVTVEGHVSHVYSPRLFAISGEGALIKARVPVIARVPIPALFGRPADRPVLVGDRVQVTGKVSAFEVVEVEKMTGTNVTEKRYVSYVGKPALVARMVVVTPLRYTTPPITTLAAITTAPNRLALVGKWARLTDVKVLKVISDRGFWVGLEPGQRLFVVLDRALDRGIMERLVDVDKGQTLTLIGVIKQMPSAEAMQKMWKVIDNTEAEALSKEPVYLHAHTVNFVAP